MKRYFIYQDTSSQKFWNIDIGETEYTVNYGRLGTDGQTQVKSYDTVEKCIKEAEKAINGKVKKGYNETSEDVVKESKEEAKTFVLSWEDQDNNKDDDYLIEKILSYKKLADLKHITIHGWGGAYEGDSNQNIIDMFIENKDKFAHIEGIYFDGIEQEECELSWIVQGDYSTLWAAMPNLKHITIQGSDNLKLGNINHENLESIIIISGGLGSDVIESVINADVPNLKKLNLYLGVDDYGFDGGIDIVQKLLTKGKYPKLEYLGLCNSEIQDEVAQEVIESKYIAQINTLDLSMGVLTDTKAQMLIDNADKLKHLKLIDLKYNYISKTMAAKLIKVLPNADLKHQKDYDEYAYPMYTE